ncbi:MAG TPA: beta-ketoacyl synthase N-terminal-like domain-containing protein, partial [Longimicrobiales bacterium]|nr:beta-ketoacyl synthase N-terminal-like domain-containing protein [Longimicrobiales bacterium]
MRPLFTNGRRQVAITGLGPVTAVGIGVEGLWEGLRREASPVRRITHFDASPFRSTMAAEVDGFEPNAFMERSRARRLDRFGHFALAATRLALDDAGFWSTGVDPARVAVQMGSAL